MLRDAPHWQPCAMSIRISFEYANLAKLCESAKCLCEFRDLAPSRIFQNENIYCRSDMELPREAVVWLSRLCSVTQHSDTVT